MTNKEIENSKNIKRYLECSSLLNEMFDIVNYCVPNCVSPKDPHNAKSFGCCAKDFTKELENSEGRRKLLTLIRAKFSPVEVKKGCCYIGSKGCMLGNYKPPLCLSYTCEQKTKQLEKMGIKYAPYTIFSELDEILDGNMPDDYFEEFRGRLKENVEIAKKWKE